MAKKIKLEDVTLDMVKRSEFGCRNCLYCSCECTNASRYEPRLALDKYPSCKGYSYYD